MPLRLSMPLVVGLLTDLELKAAQHDAQLQAALVRSAAVEAELQATLERYEAARQRVEDAKEAGAKAAHAISQNNAEIGKIHQETGPLQRRSDSLRDQMAMLQVEEPAYLQLRRQRAALAVQIDNRQKKVVAHQAKVEKARRRLAEAQAAVVTLGDSERAVGAELDTLQRQLPPPHLFMEQFELRAARAHCRMFLDKDPAPWRASLVEAAEGVLTLHQALRAGRYRLDNNSDVVGGRATATEEAVQACVAVGEIELAQELFRTATDRNLFFHHIYNIYRTWAVGLFIMDDLETLAEMLRLHQDSQGSRGAYARAFLHMILGEAEDFQREALKLVKLDWEVWSKQKNRGLGVINVTAVALHRLARTHGMGLKNLGPSVPEELLHL